MAKHTPGPWYVTGSESGGAMVVSKDEIISRWPVPTKENSVANARLIAAAPDLLYELKHLVRALEPVWDNLDIPGIATLNGAKAAITKAEGNEDA